MSGNKKCTQRRQEGLGAVTLINARKMRVEAQLGIGCAAELFAAFRCAKDELHVNRKRTCVLPGRHRGWAGQRRELPAT